MAEKRLHSVTDRERTYRREIENLKAELALASDAVRTTEGEALAEIEALETSLHESVALREELEKGVSHLQHELKRIESSRKTRTKKQHKQLNTSIKRFKTLYKNLEFHPRAIEGFLNLTNDLQLRAEEFIHNTNEDSTRLSVKRKVFSKKGTVPVFECEFAYRGRIYWKPGGSGKTQILVIGTKHTQTKDLAYLEGL
jgi:chromosome segregation ATPase